MAATDEFGKPNRYFLLIEDRETEQDWECSGCAFCFTTNSTTFDNLLEVDGKLFIVCPICQKKGKK